jgi:hypothetical protein
VYSIAYGHISALSPPWASVAAYGRERYFVFRTCHKNVDYGVSLLPSSRCFTLFEYGMFRSDCSYSNKFLVASAGITYGHRLPSLPLVGHPLRPLAPRLLHFPPRRHSGPLHSSFRSLYDYHHPQSVLLGHHRIQPHRERLLVG